MAETSEVAKLPESGTMAASRERFNWVGLNPAQMKSIAQAMAISGMFPDIEKDSAKAFVKIMAGQEMGIPPFQAMSDISIIEGKAAPGGNLFASKVKASGRYDYRVKRWDLEGCEIEFFENMPSGKRDSLGISSFKAADAKAAGMFDPLCINAPLEHANRKIERKSKYGNGGTYSINGCLCKDNWKKYPRNMFFNRAISSGVRTYCPDALGGVNAYTPEELGASVDEEGRAIIDAQQEPQPERKAIEPAPVQKSAVQLIGEELLAKGFKDKLERQTIAFKLAGVDSVEGLNEEDWLDVLDHIKNQPTEDLHALLKPALPAEEEGDEPMPTAPAEQKSVSQAMADDDPMPENFLKSDDNAAVTDEDLEALDNAPQSAPAPSYVVPEFKRGGSSLPRPDMTKLYKKWLKDYGLHKADDIAGFCRQAIGKKAPATFDDYELILGVLAEELNGRAEQKALV